MDAVTNGEILTLSTAQMAYLDYLLSHLADLPDDCWEDSCKYAIATNDVFSKYCTDSVWQAWLAAQTRH